MGVGYTFGPTPISRSPYGEGVSGVTMGLVIPFLIMEINAPGLAQITFNGWNAAVLLNVAGLLKLCLVCVPLIFCIANIMLANNICDLEADKATRYTMPRHIGRKNAVRVFAALYGLVYVAIIAACALRVIPWTCLFVLPTALPVYRNIKQFQAKQVKAETFIVSIRNFLLILAPYTVCMLIGAL
jgi:1,4-dihydroxy-2-naphthoate octaprenyltransferase